MTLQERLRKHAVSLRTNSMPLKNLIPLLNEAADALDSVDYGKIVVPLGYGLRHTVDIHCKEKLKPGGCQLHNLQCGWPACNKVQT